MNLETLFSSKSNEWSTPQYFFDKLDETYNFGLDTASTKENAKCNLYLTEEDNSLSCDWQDKLNDDNESIWCNPPYGRELGKWVEKAYQESTLGDSKVVMLIPSRTDTKYWHRWIFGKASKVFFIKGRLKFGGHENSAPFPSAVIVFDSTDRGETKYSTMLR